MKPPVISIEVLRCHECRVLLPPHEPLYRRQLKTAVEVGTHTGRIDRYEVVDLCANCEAYFARKEEEEQNTRW